MRIALSLLMVIVLVGPALAGGNKDVRAYITFDPDSLVHRADPAPYTPTTCYVMLDSLAMGTTGVSLFIEVTDGASLVTGYTKPAGWLEMPYPSGDFWTAPGVTFATGGEGCVTDQPVVVARISLLPSGRPGDIMIRDHGAFPRDVTDCHVPPQIDDYRVLSHGALYKDPVPATR